MTDFNFSDQQQKTINAAITLLSGLFILAIVLIFFGALGVFFSTFSNVLLPLAVAAIMALVFKPYYEWLRGLCKGRPIPAVVILFLTVLLPLIAFLWFFGALLVGQLIGLMAKFPEWLQAARELFALRWPDVMALWESYGLTDKLRTFFQEQGGFIAKNLQSIADKIMSAGMEFSNAVAKIFSWAVFPIYFTFFIMAKSLKTDQLQGFLPFLKPETRSDVLYLIDQFIAIIVAFFRGQLLVALAQGVLYAVGFMLVGLQYGFILGLILGFLNIIPYLGSIVGLGVTIPLAYFQAGGGLWKAAGVLVAFAIVQMIESYILTPKIIGQKTGLHPLAIIISILFWGSVFSGIAGMILAIPLTACLVIFWRLAKAKYIKEVV